MIPKRSKFRFLLGGKDPFQPLFLMVLLLPASFSVPLSEAEGSNLPLSTLTVISVFTTLLAFLVILSLKPLFKTRVASGALVPIISAVAGLVKGWSSWQLGELVGQEQNPLFTRLLVSMVSWMLFLTLAAYFKEQVLESLTVNRKLKSQITQAQSQFDSLEQQLEWLKATQLKGLSQQLAAKFVKITKRLNELGAGPGAYQDLAKELRDASRNQVRARSVAVWNGIDTTSPQKLRELFSTVPNPLLASALFFFSAALNTIRLEGLSADLLAIGGSSAVLFAWLWTTRSSGWLHNFTWLILLPAGTAFHLALSNPVGFSIGNGASGALWAQALVLFASLWKLAVESQRELTDKLNLQLSKTQADAQWLAIQLESQNLEVAKYLHAILQTRLMSYAMQLEGKGLSPVQIGELTDLLANPLKEFQSRTLGLKDSLNNLTAQWSPIVSVSIASLPKLENDRLDTATLQVIQEAIANSVRHGLADRITVKILDAETRVVEVEDNGLGPRVGEPGLGSAVFDSLCTDWSLVRSNLGGGLLRAELSLAKTEL